MDLISSMSLIVDLPNRKLVQDKNNRSHEIIPSSHRVATVKALETLKLPQWEKDVADIALKHQEVFARNKLQCGKTSGEVRVDGPDLKPHSQYWYPVATEEGILSTIKELVEQGVLLPTESPCNSLIWPVMKTDGKTWRLMVDYRELNKVIPRLAPVVAKYNEVMATIASGAKWFSILDLSNAFFYIPLDPSTWHKFAFTYRERQYTFSQLAQGLQNAPSICHCQVSNMWSTWKHDGKVLCR
ncbi:unnamed protein product [Natator depressus]